MGLVQGSPFGSGQSQELVEEEAQINLEGVFL